MKKNSDEIQTTKSLLVFVLVLLNILISTPVIIRLIWAAAIFSYSEQAFSYIICWIIIPEESKCKRSLNSKK